MQNQEPPPITRSPSQPARLHYLDWLRVIAILAVFLYHTTRPFNLMDWHIKNAEQSYFLTGILLFFEPWGMPFFFLIAGTGTWFALRHRNGRQYVTERVKRLLIPYIAGCILLTPIMLTIEWMHKIQSGAWNGTFEAFVSQRGGVPISPQIFGWAGYHLWFLGFLFSFSLLALPLFLWLKGEPGQRIISWWAARCEQRGGILLAIIPLLVVQFALRPFFTQGEHNWADFFFTMTYFVLGYILFTDERFTRAIARDWRLLLGLGGASGVIAMIPIMFLDAFDWFSMPTTPHFYVMWTLVVIYGWCCVMLILYVGMRFLNFSNRWLQYGQEAILPFFVFHQPVIMLIALFVVQWDADILPKWLVVLVGSFLVTIGLYELVIRHIKPLRMLFGMKQREENGFPSIRLRHIHS